MNPIKIKNEKKKLNKENKYKCIIHKNKKKKKTKKKKKIKNPKKKFLLFLLKTLLNPLKII